ncbi:MAG: hypothetical protein EA397_09665 [Deltaproteobacteria bacterium]|nr:MAG: hypothetical protein EA397_09665 [Deltaproteobacteria bacterium]
MRSIWLLTLLLVGCGSGELAVSPAALDFGEVDFHQERPDEGYDALEVVLRNDGSRPLDLSIRSFDSERLQLGARFEEEPSLPRLEPGSQQVITVGVWAYRPGEWDQLVEGSFRIHGDQLRDPVAVPWSFTPVRNM